MKRRLHAILAADVVGYSRLMAEDEAKTLAALKSIKDEVFSPTISRHGGRIFKLLGDGALVTMPAAAEAVEAALVIQRSLAAMPELPRLRIGINVGDVVEGDDDMFGDCINIAARLEALAPPGGICISALVRECLRAELGAEFADAGNQRLKNIERPVGVFNWPSGAALALGEADDMPSDGVSVAVLPFEDLAGDPAKRDLAAGLNEDLLATLSSIDEIRLATSIPSREGLPLAQVGRELGVDWILRGSVRAAGSRLRAGCQLIECASGRTVWAQRFEGDLTDTFGFVDGIVEEVAATLQVTVADGEQAMVWRSEAGDTQAYQHFLNARASYKDYRRPGIARARDLYEKALAINPRFPAALVGLARTHIEDVSWGWSPDREESCATARRLLEEALEVAPSHALACAEMAHLLMSEKDFESGLEWATRATRLAPALGDAYHVCATLLNCLGRSDDAMHYAREAIRRTPVAPDFYYVALCDAYVGEHRWRDCVTLARRILARRPDWLMTRAALAISLIGLGLDREARAQVNEIRSRSPRFSASRWRQTMFYPDRSDMPALEAMLVDAGLPP